MAGGILGCWRVSDGSLAQVSVVDFEHVDLNGPKRSVQPYARWAAWAGAAGNEATFLAWLRSDVEPDAAATPVAKLRPV
jgi:hypothetical protein